MENLRRLHDRALEASRGHGAGTLPYDAMKRAWDEYFGAAEQIMSRLDLKTSIAYAYQAEPREERHADTEHIIVEEDFSIGRIRRRRGDALCRNLERFQAVEALDLNRPPNCIRCLETAEEIIRTRSNG